MTARSRRSRSRRDALTVTRSASGSRGSSPSATCSSRRPRSGSGSAGGSRTRAPGSAARRTSWNDTLTGSASSRGRGDRPVGVRGSARAGAPPWGRPVEAVHSRAVRNPGQHCPAPFPSRHPPCQEPRRSRDPHRMRLKPHRPSNEILSGESADVYFDRARRIMEREGLDPIVAMEVFSRGAGILCGIDEAKNLLAYALEHADPAEVTVEGLDDGDSFSSKEVVLRIRARYRQFGLYETAILGMMAQATGWATAAHECVEAATPQPVISFGARHVHPDVTDVLDYAAIVGGCVGASTPAGARLAGLNPTGTMPHSLVLIVGDTLRAAQAFDRDLEPDVPRIVLVDTFKDEAEEALRRRVQP